MNFAMSCCQIIELQLLLVLILFQGLDLASCSVNPPILLQSHADLKHEPSHARITSGSIIAPGDSVRIYGKPSEILSEQATTACHYLKQVHDLFLQAITN